MFKGISTFFRTYPAAISGFVIAVLGTLEAWPVKIFTPQRDGLLIAVLAAFLALFTHQAVTPNIKLNGNAELPSIIPATVLPPPTP